MGTVGHKNSARVSTELGLYSNSKKLLVKRRACLPLAYGLRPCLLLFLSNFNFYDPHFRHSRHMCSVLVFSLLLRARCGRDSAYTPLTPLRNTFSCHIPPVTKDADKEGRVAAVEISLIHSSLLSLNYHSYYFYTILPIIRGWSDSHRLPPSPPMFPGPLLDTLEKKPIPFPIVVGLFFRH